MITIGKVAARAGVSPGTVSKVLNSMADGQIALATQQKVRQAANELGYHPSAVARGLVRRRMDTLGLVLPVGQYSPTTHPFFTALFNDLLKAAAAQHQNTMVFTGETWRDAAQSLPRFRDGRCDGLLLFYQPHHSDMIPALLDASVPTVLVSDVWDEPRLSYVDVDNVHGARTMTEYLLSLGHRRITLVCEEEDLSFILPRREGFEQAMVARGLSPDTSNVVSAGYTNESVYAAISTLMDVPEPQRPTALFCLSDSLAMFTIAALMQHGLRVPQDISVAGFNGDAAAERVYPPLTTMRQPYEKIGEAAVSLLMAQIEDRSERGRRIILPTELIIRQSTAPISDT